MKIIYIILTILLGCLLLSSGWTALVALFHLHLGTFLWSTLVAILSYAGCKALASKL